MLNQNIYICLATLIGCCHGYHTKLLHVNVNVCMHVGCVFSLVTPFVHPVVCMLPRQGPVEHLYVYMCVYMSACVCGCVCVCVCTCVCAGMCVTYCLIDAPLDTTRNNAILVNTLYVHSRQLLTSDLLLHEWRNC